MLVAKAPNSMNSAPERGRDPGAPPPAESVDQPPAQEWRDRQQEPDLRGCQYVKGLQSHVPLRRVYLTPTHVAAILQANVRTYFYSVARTTVWKAPMPTKQM